MWIGVKLSKTCCLMLILFPNLLEKILYSFGDLLWLFGRLRLYLCHLRRCMRETKSTTMIRSYGVIQLESQIIREHALSLPTVYRPTDTDALSTPLSMVHQFLLDATQSSFHDINRTRIHKRLFLRALSGGYIEKHSSVDF